MRAPRHGWVRACLWLLVLAGGVRWARAAACLSGASVTGECQGQCEFLEDIYWKTYAMERYMNESDVISGTITDLLKTSSNTYCKYESCKWTIKAYDQNAHIAINFKNFETESNYDYVSVYNCRDSDCTSLNSPTWRYAGTLPDNSKFVAIDGSEIVILFTSDNSNELAGFTAEWSLSNAAGCICNVGYYASSSTICSACAQGTFKDTVGSGPCTACVSGKYSKASASTICTDCPANSHTWVFNSVTETTGATSCLCNAGYSYDTSSQICSACTAGKYKFYNSNAGCSDCNVGKFSGSYANTECTLCTTSKYCSSTGCTACAPCVSYATTLQYGAESQSFCKCNAGYSGDASTGSQCSACIGSYKSTIDNSACTKCSTGKFSSVEGATSPATCQDCSVGKYCSIPGCNVCSSCVENATTSSTGAVSQSYCKCNAGYSGDASTGSQCSACIGSYKSTIDNSACTKCSTGKSSSVEGATSPATCQDCSVGKYCSIPGCNVCSSCVSYATTSSTGAIDSSSCVCNAGYSGYASQGSQCSACLAGTFKYKGDGTCVKCLLGEYSHVTAATSSTTCQLCEVGKYCETSGCDACTNCVLYASTYNYLTGESTSGAYSQTACRCNRGYEGSAYVGAPCKECVAGKYRDNVLLISCSACAAGKYSALTAATTADTCTACAGGKYSAVPAATTAGTCTECSVGQYTNSTGSSSLGACLSCGDGEKVSASRLGCVECAFGEYGEGGVCATCPSLSTTLQTGSTQYSDCVCAAGAYGRPRETFNNDSQQGELTLTCSSCPAGSTSDAGSQSRYACFCNYGYTGNSGGPCAACAAGTYKDERGLGECKACPAASSSPAAAVSFEECQCAAGFEPADGECVECPAGKFSNGTDPCVKCEGMKYAPRAGMSVCLSCPLKVFASDNRLYCDCGLGTEWTDGTCTACAAGKFDNNLVNWTASKPWDASHWCEDCAPGTFTNQVMQSVCNPCAGGKYAGAGASVCSSCPANKTSSNGVGCTCDAGYGWDAVAKDCVACAPGKFKASDDDELCESCETGSSNVGVANEDCDLSAPGYVSVAGVFQACAENTYQPNVGGSACLPCPLGAASAEGAAQCECEAADGYAPNPAPNPAPSPTGATPLCVCAAGYAGAGCEACAAGTYQAHVNASECDECSPGSYSAGGATGCTACAAGSFAADFGMAACEPCEPGTAQAATGSTTCGNCSAGSFAGEGATICTRCDVGRFADVRAAECTRCESGSYSSTTGARVCTACESGKFSGLGVALCTACVAGKFSGLKASQCTDCSAGKFSLNGTGTCTACGAGKYSEPGAAECEACAPGTFSAGGTGTCAACGAGKFSGPGASECAACAPGTFSAGGAATCTACGAGKFSPHGGAECEFCPVGHFMKDTGAQACVPCAPGSYASLPGATACTPCAVGTAGTASAATAPCAACPEGAYAQHPGATACESCANGTLVSVNQGCVHTCGPGERSGNLSGEYGCHPCPPGSFRDAEEHTLADCEVCGDGQDTSAARATACACARGFAHDGEVCIPCEPGHYKDWVGDDACLRCRAELNELPARATSTACPCTIGYYLPAAGPDRLCTACPAGSYTDDVGAEGAAACSVCLWSHMTSDCPGARPCVCQEGFGATEFGCVPCPGCPCGADCVCLSAAPRAAPAALVARVLVSLLAAVGVCMECLLAM